MPLNDNIADALTGVPTAGSTSAVPTKLDLERVKRWAELLDSDPQAREFMRAHVAGGELAQLTELQQKQQRLELALEHGIPAELAEVHLTAGDPALLAVQAESLAGLLHGGTGALARGNLSEGQSVPSSATGEGARATNNFSPANPLPAYEAAPVDREDLLTRQFVALYEH